jgi:hypothetical protein
MQCNVLTISTHTFLQIFIVSFCVGSVSVYYSTDNLYIEQPRLYANNGADMNRFGHSVSVGSSADGRIVMAVGSPGHAAEAGVNRTGEEVYLYAINCHVMQYGGCFFNWSCDFFFAYYN